MQHHGVEVRTSQRLRARTWANATTADMGIVGAGEHLRIQNYEVQPVWTGARRTSTKAVPALLGDAAESVAPKIALRAFSILGAYCNR